jgi:GNAT superfamily N-acetyltransferase
MTAAVHFPAYFNAAAFIVQELFWWVKPESRGTGAGGELLTEIEQWAAEKGAAAVFMIALADKNEEKMQNLYARMGYRPLERTFAREVM